MLRLLSIAFLFTSLGVNVSALEVIDLGKRFDHTVLGCKPGMFHHIESDHDVNSGNTSIRREGRAQVTWKSDPNGNGYGYYRRDRDLGQVFSTPPGEALEVNSIIVRTAIGTKAVGNVDSAPVQVQILKVVSDQQGPRIDQNGTPPGSQAKHGWDVKYNRADDFVVGVKYVPFFLSEIGEMPDLPPTTRSGIDQHTRKATQTEPGHLRYLQFEFDPQRSPVLEPDQRYAFVIGFAEPGKNRRFALANQVTLGDVSVLDRVAQPSLMTDPNGKPWWGIRREGNGVCPPTMTNRPQPPTDKAEREQMLDEAVFPKNHTATVMPRSEGYPDVDTYRVFQFYVETSPAAAKE